MTDKELTQYFMALKQTLSDCDDSESLSLTIRLEDAWEKSIPKTLRPDGCCPVCGRLLCDCEIYCCNCGQRIGWEEARNDTGRN